MNGAEICSGRLYVVSLPIGHPRDITLRALDILRSVDGVICEERRIGETMLKRLEIAPRELLLLNEHTEAQAAVEIARRLERGQTLALISDCGTPVFADPGHKLVNAAVRRGIPVIPVPGPAALTAALAVCDFKVERFIFEGFLPREKEQRRRRLRQMHTAGVPLVIMDAPYRLNSLLEDVAAVFGADRRVILACDLTLPGEQVYRGPIVDVARRVGKRKCEFVLIVRD